MRSKRIQAVGLVLATLAASMPAVAIDHAGAQRSRDEARAHFVLESRARGTTGVRSRDASRGRARAANRSSARRGFFGLRGSAARRSDANARRASRRGGRLRGWAANVAVLGVAAVAAVGVSHGALQVHTVETDLSSTHAVATHAPRYLPDGHARSIPLPVGASALSGSAHASTKVVLYHQDGARWTSKTINAPLEVEGQPAKSVTVRLGNGREKSFSIVRLHASRVGNHDERVGTVAVNLGDQTAKSLLFSNTRIKN